MKKKIKYTWYVKPLNAHANAAIAEIVDEEHFSHKTKMWKCDIGVVLTMQRSKESLGLKFRVFNQQGNGQIRECPPFLFKKKKRGQKTKAVR